MRKAILLSILLVLCLMPASAWANSPGTVVIKDVKVIYNCSLKQLEGEIKYVRNLETPHYELNGVVLEGNFDFKSMLDYYVRVKGYMLGAPSIFMKERMLVKEYEVLYKNKLVELEGVVKYVKGLETPHYELNGIVLEGNFDLKGLQGYYIKAKGYMLEGPSIFMKERMLVKDFEILSKGELIKLKGVVREGLRFNGFILSGKMDLKPYIGKEVEITARWDLQRSNARQKYLQVIEIKEVKTRTLITRERIDPVTGTRYTFRYYI